MLGIEGILRWILYDYFSNYVTGRSMALRDRMKLNQFMQEKWNLSMKEREMGHRPGRTHDRVR
jgi:hypothetical protein